MKKSIILLSITILALSSGCSINGNDTKDDFFDKQWYLMNKPQNCKIIDDAKDGFVKEYETFDSTINLGVLNFWDKKIDDKKLVIALIDSKVDISHIDLKKHIWKNVGEVPNNGIDDDKNGYIDDYEGWNFYEKSNAIEMNDDNAIHGTHCAGIIAAAGNYDNELISGLDLVKNPRYPACINLENVITVGSVDCLGKKSSFSNYGEGVIDVLAPGELIYSTLPNGLYGYESGTSMAAPIVTGIIGAYYYSGYSIDEAVDKLLCDGESVVEFQK